MKNNSININKGILMILIVISMTNFSSADILSVGGSGGSEVLLGYGNQIETFFSGDIDVATTIPEDIDGFLSTTSKKIVPSNELLGKWIIFLIFLLLIFSKDINKSLKKIKIKSKW